MPFDMPTNFTNLYNQSIGVSGVGSLFQYGMYATGGWFGYGVLAMIFIMSFGVSVMASVGRAFASGSFITLVFSVYFARIGLVPPSIPFILAIFTIVGFFWAKGERTNY